MPNCSKDTSIPLLGIGNVQVKNIKFSTDWKAVEVYQIGAAVFCTSDIEADVYLGAKIVNNELVFTDAISGLTTNINSTVANHPAITINFVGGVLNIIGIDDTGSGFTVTKMNVRYDSATRSVKFQV